MAIDRLPDPSDPDAVGRAEFATARRGFDQIQVRSYLTVVAAELQRLKNRETELSREVSELRAEMASAPKSVDDVDDAVLTARLGEEMARVLEAARAGAAEKLHRADETATKLVADATAEAERIVGGAQAAFDAEVDKGRARGKELVAEARLVRERILDDLARRRRTIRTQVEQLRAGRDRLLASHGEIRRALDEIEQELDRELPESRVAAELTGRRMQHEPPGSAGLIELEIEEAARAGRPLVTPEELAARVDDEPAEWVNRGVSAVATGDDDHEHHEDEPTDEIPVLDHFGTDDDASHAEAERSDAERSEIVLSEVGNRRRDNRNLPREPVPVIAAPDAVEAVRVVSAISAELTAQAEAAKVAAAADAVGEDDGAEDAVADEPVADAVADEPVADEDEPVGDDGDVTEDVSEIDASSEPEPAPREAAGSGVDDLFARIRESRAENVARAREVLDQPLPMAGAVALAQSDATTAEAEAGDDAADVATLDPDAVRLLQRDEAVAGIETVIIRKLKRMLADEQNEIQDLVRRQRGKVRRDDVLGARDHHVGRYVAAVGGELLAGVSAGASFYGGDTHSVDTDLSALEERLAHELLDPLRQLLARGVDDAEGDEDELLDRVRSAYREVKSQRVDVAARVVTLSAFNLGVVTAQPPGAYVRWSVDPVAGCSADCDDNALAGAVLAGEQFPTGAVYPPNHPGCRCLLVPADQ